MSAKGLVNKYRGAGGVGRSRKGGGSSVLEPTKRGGLCNFDLQVGVGHLIYSLTLNCYSSKKSFIQQYIK